MRRAQPLFASARAAGRVRAAQRGVTTGAESLLRATGVVQSWAGGEGYVHAQGEDWHARSTAPLAPGQAVHVAGRDGLTLIVEPDNPA